MTSASPSLQSGLVSYNLEGSQFPTLQAINMENAKGDGFTTYRGSAIYKWIRGERLQIKKLFGEYSQLQDASPAAFVLSS